MTSLETPNTQSTYDLHYNYIYPFLLTNIFIFLRPRIYCYLYMCLYRFTSVYIMDGLLSCKSTMYLWLTLCTTAVHVHVWLWRAVLGSGLWCHTGWVDTLHNQGVGGWGAVFTSARSAVPPYSLPILASRTRLNWRYHMTGILSTQQEVALQTVCFALFLKLEFNGVGETVKQKEKEKKKLSSVD